MRLRATAILVMAALFLAPTAGRAALLPYEQSFEGMSQADPAALSADGWLVYGNVFDPAWNRIGGYGAFPAPNNAFPPPAAFCAVATGEGGDSQGTFQLSVYSDYENANHGAGNWVESNVYQERTLDSGDPGLTWYFEFDAKRGNIGGTSKAIAFIKTLDPGNGWAMTNFLKINMTFISEAWHRFSISIPIDPGLVGQVLQFGFANTATGYLPSGIFYDNVVFLPVSSVDVTPVASRGGSLRLSARGNPSIGQSAQVLAFTLAREAPVTVRVYDVAGKLVTTLVDRNLGAGAHEAVWQGRDGEGHALPSGVYLAEVTAGAERAVTKLQRLR